MDTKVSSEFWDDSGTGELTPDEKLCALWLMTNSRVKLSGFVEINERTFKFHTGLETEALQRTIEALPKTFRRVNKGVWMPNFIRRQIGFGKALAANNITQRMCRELDGIGSDGLKGMVAEKYPEIRHLIFAVSSPKLQALHKPLTRGCQTLGEERRGEESLEEGVGETELAPEQGELLDPNRTGIASPTSEPTDSDFEKKSGAVHFEKKDPAAVVPLAAQVKRFGAIFGRPVGARWSNMEEVTLSAVQPVSESDLRLIEWRYRQPEEERDPHRQKLLTLLQNLPGEIDAARAQLKRHSGDITTNGAPRQEPPGWPKILEKKYRRPDDTEWVCAYKSFYELPDTMQAEILEEIKQQQTCEKNEQRN